MTGIHMMVLGVAGKFALLPSDITITDIVVSPSTATASLTLNSSGTYTCLGSIKPADGTWLKGIGSGADYEARLTVVSGSFTTGTTGSWLSLGSSRQWTLTRGPVGSVSAAGTLEIRDPTSGLVFTSCNLILNAEVN